MTKQNPRSPTLTALAVNQQVVQSAIDMGRIFISLERVYGYNVHASYTGVCVGRPGEKPVYSDGEYQPVQAKGAQQCAMYRLRLLTFCIWAMRNAPTPEIKEHEQFLKAQIQ